MWLLDPWRHSKAGLGNQRSPGVPPLAKLPNPVPSQKRFHVLLRKWWRSPDVTP